MPGRNPAYGQTNAGDVARAGAACYAAGYLVFRHGEYENVLGQTASSQAASPGCRRLAYPGLVQPAAYPAVPEPPRVDRRGAAPEGDLLGARTSRVGYAATACMPRSATTGPRTLGLTSKSKTATGRYREQHALGMSTMPLIRPSMGAEPSSRYACSPV